MKLSSTIWVLWRELLLFVWAVWAVIILGMSTMYYKAIMLAVQDILPTVWVEEVIVADTVFQAQDSMQEQLTWWEDIQHLLEEITYRGAKVQKSLTIEDYMDARLSDYTFAFNDLPPGRRLLISSIDVDAPIVDVPYASDEKLQNGDFDQELREGVVKYPFTVEPWNKGNSLLFGHSSVTAWEDVQNPFWYVFYKLQDLEPGERFDVIWDGQLYSYEINNRVIKLPEDVWAEIEKYDQSWENFLTLMACYPRLTDHKRVLMVAKQLENRIENGSNIFAMK